MGFETILLAGIVIFILVQVAQILFQVIFFSIRWLLYIAVIIIVIFAAIGGIHV